MKSVFKKGTAFLLAIACLFSFNTGATADSRRDIEFGETASTGSYEKEGALVKENFELMYGFPVTVEQIIPVKNTYDNISYVFVQVSSKAGQGYAIVDLEKFAVTEMSIDNCPTVSGTKEIVYGGLLHIYEVESGSRARDIYSDQDVTLQIDRRSIQSVDLASEAEKDEILESIREQKSESKEYVPLVQAEPDTRTEEEMADDVMLPEEAERRTKAHSTEEEGRRSAQAYVIYPMYDFLSTSGLSVAPAGYTCTINQMAQMASWYGSNGYVTLRTTSAYQNATSGESFEVGRVYRIRMALTDSASRLGYTGALGQPQCQNVMNDYSYTRGLTSPYISYGATVSVNSSNRKEHFQNLMARVTRENNVTGLYIPTNAVGPNVASNHAVLAYGYEQSNDFPGSANWAAVVTGWSGSANYPASAWLNFDYVYNIQYPYVYR